MAADAPDPDETYAIVERDTVPAPAPLPSDSLQKRIADLVKWLQPTDFLSPGNEYMKHLHSHVPGTGTWIQESALFRAWAGSDSADADCHRCLHVRGVAGSGKSVFAAHTVRQLQDSGAIVLFFFFRQIVDKNHTARYLVRDFAAQLLPHCPALVTSLTPLSQENGISGNELELVWPALVKALEHGGAGGKPAFCIVDALDEMDDGEFEGMAQKLVALGTSTTHRDTVRVMMTSRPLPHIQQALEHPRVTRLKLDPALLSPDVARYVDARLATLDPPLSDDKNELVKQTICERANGLFLQARLVVDNLVEGLEDGRITEETLPDSLDRLPRTLRAVYEDLLKEHARRSGVTAEDQAKILMCVTHASRPLRLIELGSLLSRMLGVDLGRGKELVRAGCGRLLELLEDETVSVIHHSFTEFLHDVTRNADENCAFPVLEDEASHAMLAVLSLEYLNGCPHVDITVDDEGGKLRRTGFLQEGGGSTEQDAKTTPGHPAIDQLLNALDCYLTPGEPAFENLVIMDWDGPLSASFSVLHLVTALHKGERIPEYVMEHLVERDRAVIDGRDLEGVTPLAYAAKCGHSQLARVLLAKGADTKIGSNDGLTPLHRAAREGHAEIVRLLLDAGVDPLIKTRPVLREYNRYEDWYDEYTEEEAEERRETAFSHAFLGDNPEVVKAFMPFVPPDQINWCFHQVVDMENVKTVLETGKVDIDSFQGGTTKLFRAARSYDPGLVRLLLQHGADPTRRCVRDNLQRYDDDISMDLLKEDSERGPTPLHAFGPDRRVLIDDGEILPGGDDKEKAAECIRLLIEAGADVNATMDHDREYLGHDMTPLHLAVQKTDSPLVYWGSMDKSEEFLTEILLSAGADPNAKTKQGNTPMHLANTEKPRIFELLIQHGADINAANARGRTSLLEMINRLVHHTGLEGLHPDFKVFDLLLERGADVKIADNDGKTIFHHILHSISTLTDNPETIPFIEKLLRAGADVNRKNKKGEPPLWAYRQCDLYRTKPTGRHDEDIFRVLVDAGMDLNARDDEGRTILWVLGTRHGADLELIEKFVRLGADPAALTNDGKSLLHLAVEHSKSPEWFRYLISAGVKPDALGKDGDTLIHTVLRKSETYPCAQEVIRILIEEAAVPPLAKNAKEQSALLVAGSLKHLDLALENPAFRGLDINEPDNEGLTSLHHAVALGEQAVWKLIRAGADSTALAAGNLSPLHVATRTGEAGVVGLLLAQYRELGVLKKHVNLRGEGRAPLHYACCTGNPDAVWALLRSGADPRLADDRGWTPLHALAEFEGAGSPPMADIVAMLQRAGVDLGAEAAIQMEAETAPRMLTPLDLAVERKCWPMVRALIARGVEPDNSHSQSEEFVLATDKDKAAEEARKAQASMPRPPQDSSSRNQSARWRGRWAAGPGAKMPPEERTWFVTSGQDVLDLEAQKPYDNVANVLPDVMRDGDYDAIKEYAQLGGDVIEPRGWHRETFLHRLVEDGQAELLEYFGDKVAAFEAQECVRKGNGSCGTLLGTACERSRPSLRIVQLLVDGLGVDVNAVYNRSGYIYKLRGGTALHILASSAYFWQIEALEYLLSRGANIEARNADGMTPLLAAIDNQWPDGFWKEETVRVLLKHGADVNATVTRESGARGPSALEMSGYPGKPGITKLLLEHGASVESCPGLLTRAVREWIEPGVVKLLLDAESDPNRLPLSEETQKEGERAGDEQSDSKPRYALHEAARPSTRFHPESHARQQAVIELLVSHGADAYAPYPDGSFVLQAIIEDRGRVDDFLPRFTQANCNRRGSRQRTLLTSACIPTVPAGSRPSYRGPPPTPTVMPNVITTLLDAGADPLAVDDEGRTPLYWFCTLPGKQLDDAHRNAFMTLAHHGPAALHMPDKQGKPLHLALATYASRAQTSPFFIQHLLSLGADPADPDPLTGNSALHFIAPRLVGEPSAAADATAMFRELARRLDINARNAAGETPVLVFAAAGWEGTRDPEGKVSHPEYALQHDVTHAKALDVFVELGADLGVVDGKGRTLLHVTAGREGVGSGGGLGREEREDVEGMFRRLIGLGVDPRVEDEQLRTAIDVAVARELWGIVRLFSEDGRREMEKEGKGEKEDEAEDGGSELEGFADVMDDISG